MNKEQILADGHWIYPNYTQRILSKHWRELLLNDNDNLIFKGKVVKLKAKSLGFGVVEVFKENKVEE